MVPPTPRAQWSYLWALADGRDFAVWYKSIVQLWRSQLTGGWKHCCPWVAGAGFREASTFKRCNLDKFPRLTKWTKWSLKVKCALFSRPDILCFMPMENWDAYFEFKHFSKFVANYDLLRAQLLFCHWNLYSWDTGIKISPRIMFLILATPSAVQTKAENINDQLCSASYAGKLPHRQNEFLSYHLSV